MRLRHKDVFPAITVIIKETRAPAGECQSCTAQAGLIGHVTKCAIAIVAKEHVAFIGKVSDNDVGKTIVIVIAEVHAHAGEGLSVFVVSHSGK